MHYEKPDVALNSMLEGKPCICSASLGESEKVAELFSAHESLGRCKKSSTRIN
jgi:hypothetical protein